MSVLGKRIIAWRGTRQDQGGVVIRLDGVYHCYIKWDNGDETHYEMSAIMLDTYYNKIN